MSAPTREDFEAWAEHPITRYVLSGVARYAELQKLAWQEDSWRTQKADQEALTRMAIRADAYDGLAKLTYEQAISLHDEEPVAE